jgi:hypothetical protein
MAEARSFGHFICSRFGWDLVEAMVIAAIVSARDRSNIYLTETDTFRMLLECIHETWPWIK